MIASRHIRPFKWTELLLRDSVYEKESRLFSLEICSRLKTYVGLLQGPNMYCHPRSKVISPQLISSGCHILPPSAFAAHCYCPDFVKADRSPLSTIVHRPQSADNGLKMFRRTSALVQNSTNNFPSPLTVCFPHNNVVLSPRAAVWARRSSGLRTPCSHHKS